jgi:hypothetical protein
MSANELNTAFCRTMLSLVMEDVKEHTTAAERKGVWTYRCMKDHWEFHGPDEFYWHGSADGGYDARAKGWAAYLRHKGVEGYKMEGDQ